MHRPGERIYQIENGRVRPRIAGAEARRKIDRAMHGIVLRLKEPATRPNAERVPQEHRYWVYDLRVGRNKTYGSLLRFIDVSKRAGVDRATLKMIPQWIASYIDDLFDDAQDAAA